MREMLTLNNNKVLCCLGVEKLSHLYLQEEKVLAVGCEPLPMLPDGAIEALVTCLAHRLSDDDVHHQHTKEALCIALDLYTSTATSSHRTECLPVLRGARDAIRLIDWIVTVGLAEGDDSVEASCCRLVRRLLRSKELMKDEEVRRAVMEGVRAERLATLLEPRSGVVVE